MNLIIGNGGVARKLYNVRSWMILPWLIINVQATIGPRGMEISQVSKTCMGRCFVVGWRCLYWIRPLAEISSGHHLGPSLVPRETEKRLVPSIYLSLCCVKRIAHRDAKGPTHVARPSLQAQCGCPPHGNPTKDHPDSNLRSRKSFARDPLPPGQDGFPVAPTNLSSGILLSSVGSVCHGEKSRHPAGASTVRQW